MYEGPRFLTPVLPDEFYNFIVEDCTNWPWVCCPLISTYIVYPDNTEQQPAPPDNESKISTYKKTGIVCLLTSFLSDEVN